MFDNIADGKIICKDSIQGGQIAWLSNLFNTGIFENMNSF